MDEASLLLPKHFLRADQISSLETAAGDPDAKKYASS